MRMYVWGCVCVRCSRNGMLYVIMMNDLITIAATNNHHQQQQECMHPSHEV